MDQVVAEVSRRTGLSHEQAQQAVQAVLDVVKSRLPASMAGQVDVLLGAGGAGGSGAGGGLAQQAEGLLGGMLGGSSGAATPPPSAPGNPSGNQTV